MSRKRRYQLLCPVARALDVVGDRWSLLILRDMHAGPARFQQLQEGLGMATNLLSTRLGELSEAGLIERPGDDRQGAYALTELGRNTDRILWELMRFGSLIDRDPDPREPGNVRTIALPLRMMLSAVSDRPTMAVRLLIGEEGNANTDGDRLEAFAINVNPDSVEVVHGMSGPDGLDGDTTEPDLVLRCTYEGFLDLAEGQISLEEFGTSRCQIVAGDRLGDFVALMAAALQRAEDGLV